MARRLSICLQSALILAFMLLAPIAARADQSSLCSPTTGTVSGLQLTTNYNNAINALATASSGATAPTNACGGVAVKGQMWIDTSATPNIVKQYDGSSTWVPIGYLDATNHVWIPIVGGYNDTVSSATITDLCSKSASSLTISGVTTITGFGSACQVGQTKFLRFSGILTLTHSSSLFLPNAATNITTAANDTALAIYLGSGNWLVATYTKVDGSSLSANANLAGAVAFTGIISPTALAAQTDNWAPTGIASAETIRVTMTGSQLLTGLTGGVTGRQIVIQNVDSADTLTIGQLHGSSSAANQFSMPFPIILPPGTSQAFRYDGTASVWRPLNLVSGGAVAGGFKNLTIVNDTGAPTTTMDVVADAVMLEDSFGNTRRVTSVNLAPAITSSGANGLDTGAAGNNLFYSINVIYNPTTNTVAGLFSVQSSCLSATLPSGYTFCAKVNWAKTDGSAHFYRQQCYGRDCNYTPIVSTNTPTLPVGASGSLSTPFTPTSTAFAVRATVNTGSTVAWVPPTAGIVRMSLWSNNGSAVAAALWDSSVTNYTQAVTTVTVPGPVSPCMNYINVAGTNQFSSIDCTFLLRDNNLYYAANTAAAAAYVRGWRDNE